MRNQFLILAAVATVAAAGCGGRVAKPVLAEQPLDARLSCEHLKGEFDNNQKRIVELEGEKKESSTNNAGYLVSGPIFLDTQGAFKKETEALNLRNARLGTLLSERGCEGAPTVSPEPAPADPQS